MPLLSFISFIIIIFLLVTICINKKYEDGYERYEKKELPKYSYECDKLELKAQKELEKTKYNTGEYVMVRDDQHNIGKIFEIGLNGFYKVRLVNTTNFLMTKSYYNEKIDSLFLNHRLYEEHWYEYCDFDNLRMVHFMLMNGMANR